jgi:hypothetical protein
MASEYHTSVCIMHWGETQQEELTLHGYSIGTAFSAPWLQDVTKLHNFPSTCVWLQNVRERHKSQIYENGMSRKISELKKDEVSCNFVCYIMRNFLICRSQLVVVRLWARAYDWLDMWIEWVRRLVRIESRWENVVILYYHRKQATSCPTVPDI